MIYYNETKSQPIFIIGTGKNYSYVCSQRFMGKTCPPLEEEPTPGRGRVNEGRLSRTVPWEPWGAIPRGDPIKCKRSERHNNQRQKDNLKEKVSHFDR